MDYVPALARWIHFMAGVMWIGLLYYFNFVQVPALKAATADGTARAAVFSLGGGRHLASGRGAPRRSVRECLSAPRRHGGNRRRGLARHHHAVQRLGPDLAEPAEDSRVEAGHGRREEQGSARRVSRLANQYRALDPVALLHGRRLVAPGALRSLISPPESKNGPVSAGPFAFVLPRIRLPISPRRASAPARGVPAPRATRSRSAAPGAARSRSARPSPHNNRSFHPRASAATSRPS